MKSFFCFLCLALMFASCEVTRQIDFESVLFSLVDSDSPVPIGEQIREIRETRSLSVEQLAALVGVTKDVIERLESGEVGDITVELLFLLQRELVYQFTVYILGDDGLGETPNNDKPREASRKIDTLTSDTVVIPVIDRTLQSVFRGRVCF